MDVEEPLGMRGIEVFRGVSGAFAGALKEGVERPVE